MVVGQPRTRRFDDMDDDRIKVSQHVRRRNTYRRNTMQRQLRIPAHVKVRLIAPTMRLAIDFDRQIRFGTEKIQHEMASRMLLAEFETSGSLAQCAPQDDLGKRQLAPQFASAADSVTGRG